MDIISDSSSILLSCFMILILPVFMYAIGMRILTKLDMKRRAIRPGFACTESMYHADPHIHLVYLDSFPLHNLYKSSFQSDTKWYWINLRKTLPKLSKLVISKFHQPYFSRLSNKKFHHLASLQRNSLFRIRHLPFDFLYTY